MPAWDCYWVSEGVAAARFSARFEGDAADQVLPARDLDAPGRSYERWLAEAHRLLGTAAGGDSDIHAYDTCCELVHQWRTFLFTDPGLPADLHPGGWPSESAAAFFTAAAEQLRPAAARFVDACLARRPSWRSGRVPERRPGGSNRADGRRPFRWPA